MSKTKLFISLALMILGTFVFWKSLFAYKEAKTHLTPASVSVSGYTRRDGTYVAPYKRRPPGGAIHDRPYEKSMLLFSVLMVIGGGLVLFPVGIVWRSQRHKDIPPQTPLTFKPSVLLKC